MIELRDVSFGYGSGSVINELSFGIQPGETLMITGPNGVGKSTLLRLLAGVVRPIDGAIDYGIPVGIDPRSRMAYLPDSLSMYRSMTPLQAASFHAGVFGTDAADLSLARRAKVDLNRPISELSVGQRVLVQLGIVLSTSPELILIDEVLHSVDPHIRGLVMERLITEMEERHPSIVMVNLNFTEVEFLVDRLIFIGREGVILDKPVTELKASVWKTSSENDTTGLPVLLSREIPGGMEHIIYPFTNEEHTAGLNGMNLTEIVTAFMEWDYIA